MNDVLEQIKKAALRFQAVGSRVTCEPPPTDTDQDYLVLDPNSAVTRFLRENEFVLGGSDIADADNLCPIEDRFTAYRRDDVNIIVTRSDTFYQRFAAATSVAKRLNLLAKSDRIALFQAVLYGREDLPVPTISDEEPVF